MHFYFYIAEHCFMFLFLFLNVLYYRKYWFKFTKEIKFQSKDKMLYQDLISPFTTEFRFLA